MAGLTLLTLFMLAAPGTARVEVRGGEAEVVAFADGVAAARAHTRDGVVELDGLQAGKAYDLIALGRNAASRAELGVRAVAGETPGFDAVLMLQTAYAVRVRTHGGAVVWSGGVPWSGGTLWLKKGIHSLVVDHAERVSSAERIIRVSGPMSLEVALEPGLVVLGRVIDETGAAVEGARIEVYADGVSVRRSTKSQKDGGFGLAGFRGDVISLRCAAPGYAETLRRVGFFPGQERARVELILRRGSSVRTSVTGTGTGGVGGTALLLPQWYEQALELPRVRAHHEPVRLAREDGMFAFGGLTPGRRYRMVVQVPGFLPHATPAFVAPVAGETVELAPQTLVQAGSIRGTVKRPGLRISCDGSEGRNTTRSDRGGHFVFEGLDPGDHWLRVRDHDESGQLVKLAAGAVAHVALKIAPAPPEHALEGVVVDDEGEPLAGIEVETAGRGAVTGEQGRFRIAGLPRGRATFSVHFTPGPGSRAFLDDPHLPHTETRVRPGTIRVALRRAGTLRVRLDSGGRPLVRASLFVTGPGGWTRRVRLPRLVRDVELTEVPVGSCEVEVGAPGVLGTSGAVAPVRRDPAEPTVVQVAVGRTVTGRVVLRRFKERPGVAPDIVDTPLGRGFVQLLDGTQRRALAVTPVEEDGSFRLEGLPVGPVILSAGVPGIPVIALAIDLTGGDATDIVVPLQEAAEAAVLVTDMREQPVLGVAIQIYHELGIDMRDLTAQGRFRGVVADDVDLDEFGTAFALVRQPSGRVSAPFLSPGSYLFRVAAEGYKPVRIGVRARPASTVVSIRENFPLAPKDLATPIRLQKARPGTDSGD